MFIHECNDAVFYFILDLSIVVDLMAESRIYLGIHSMPSLVQPVADLIDSLSVLPHRILVASDIVDRKVRRNLLCPLFQ